jgi:hypothetical protein
MIIMYTCYGYGIYVHLQIIHRDTCMVEIDRKGLLKFPYKFSYILVLNFAKES